MAHTDLPHDQTDEARRFADAAEGKRHGLLAEFVDFLRHNKKWWLAPILIVLLLVGVLIVLSSTVLAPLIYPLI